MLEKIFNKVNMTDIAVIIFVGIALNVSLFGSHGELTTILGSGLLGYLGGRKM